MTELLESVPERLRPFVSPCVGIVPVLEECMTGVDEPPLVRVACETADGEELIDATLGHAAGIGGTGFSRESACGAAIGEALERYSGSYLPAETLVRASAAELGAAAVPPESFGLFHESQYARPGFGFVPFTSETVVRWCRGWELATGAEAWLPAELVYLADSVAPGENRIGYATSSGMACGDTIDEAVERGLLELLERDAFMITWANRLTLPRIDSSSSDRLRVLDDTYFRPTGLDYAAVDLSGFHRLPTVLGVVRGAPGLGGALGIGAAAAPNLERAWWKALSEAFASRAAGLKLSLLQPDRSFADDGSDVITFEDHIRFYADERRALSAAFLAGSADTRDAREIGQLGGADAADRRAELLARMTAAGTKAFAVDVTAPDIRPTGIVVVKTVAPGLCPLDVPHAARFLGAPRLLDMSEEATLTGRGRTVEDLNPLPHPFP